jgi:hypothetical protein
VTAVAEDAPIADRLAGYRRLFDLSGRTALVLGAAADAAS